MDRLGLFSGEGVLPLQLSFRGYPRILAVAIDAAQFLASGGGQGLGEQTTSTKGSGLEYAESRFYQAGDPMRRLDWKATARLGRLVVKDYYVEGGHGTHTVYEASAPDPVSLDEISESFLRVVLTLAKTGYYQGFTVHDMEKVLYHGVGMPPRMAVATAMRYALMGVESGLEQLYEVLDPGTATDVRGILRKLESDSLPYLWLKGVDGILERGREPYRFLREFIAEEGTTQLLFISALTEPVKLMELTRYGSHRGKTIRMMLPTEPWLRSTDLEQSYLTWKDQRKLRRTFSRYRIDSAPELVLVKELTFGS